MPIGNVAQPLPPEQAPPGVAPMAPISVTKPPPPSQAPPVWNCIVC